MKCKILHLTILFLTSLSIFMYFASILMIALAFTLCFNYTSHNKILNFNLLLIISKLQHKHLYWHLSFFILVNVPVHVFLWKATSTPTPLTVIMNPSLSFRKEIFFVYVHTMFLYIVCHRISFFVIVFQMKNYLQQ